MPRGPLLQMQAGSSASSRTGSANSNSLPAGPSRLQPAAPIVESSERDRDNSAVIADDSEEESEIKFVGEQEGPPAPVIEIGAKYPPNDLAKLAQKLSTYVNKGSEVVWTQKPGNVPRALACKNGSGYNKDPSSGVS